MNALLNGARISNVRVIPTAIPWAIYIEKTDAGEHLRFDSAVFSKVLDEKPDKPLDSYSNEELLALVKRARTMSAGSA